MNKKTTNKGTKETSQAEAKKLTSELRIDNLIDAVKYAQDIIDTVREPFLVLDNMHNVVTANAAFYHTFKVTKKHTEGALIYELGNHQWDIPELRKLLEEILPKKKVFTDFEVIHNFPSIGQKTMLLNARQIDHAPLILLAIGDITERKQLEQNANVGRQRLYNLFMNAPACIAVLSGPELTFEIANPLYRQLVGEKRPKATSSACSSPTKFALIQEASRVSANCIDCKIILTSLQQRVIR